MTPVHQTSFRIPEPPPRSPIEIDADSTGDPRLSWAVHMGWRSWVSVVFLGIYFIGWATVEIGLVYKLSELSPDGHGLACFIGWSLLGVFVPRLVSGIFKPKRERISLGRSMMLYEPADSFCCAVLNFGHLQPLKQRINVPRSEISQVYIEQTNSDR